MPRSLIPKFPEPTLHGKPWKPGTTRHGSSSARGPSRTAKLLACSSAFHTRYVTKLVTVGGYRKMMFGTLFHTLRADANARQIDVPPDWLAVPLEARLESDRASYGAVIRIFDEVLGRAQLAAAVYARDKPQFQPLYPEVEAWATLAEIGHRYNITPPKGLESEIATCRMDVGGRSMFYGHPLDSIKDYKTCAPNQYGDLPQWKEDSGYWGMHWQAHVNMFITRIHAEREGWNWFPEKFLVDRITTHAPWKIDRHEVKLRSKLMKDVPKLIMHAIVKEERLRTKKRSVLKEGAMTGACYSFSGCEYLPLCLGDERTEGMHSDMYRQLGK